MINCDNGVLNEYIAQCQTRLKGILKRLDWSEENVIRDFNTNSLASNKKEIINTKISSNTATYPDSCRNENSIVLETPKLREILQSNEVEAPRSFNELQAKFSREQKLTIYEHVVKNTDKLDNNATEQVAEGEISLSDILAQKRREDKRKKRRFRKSKPTHIEEVRCLVDIQMQALQQFLGNKDQKQQPGSSQQDNVKEDNYSGDKYQEQRKLCKNYYRKGVNKDRLNEYHEDFRRQHSSRSKEHQRYNNKRHKTSLREEFPYKRTRHSRSRSKERRKRGRSQSKERCKRSTSRSKVKSKNNHKRSRYSRSCSADISKERSKYIKSRSCEKESRSRSPEFDRQRKKHNSRKYERHSRSPVLAISKEKQTHGYNHSYKSLAQVKKDGNYQKNVSHRKHNSYLENPKKKSSYEDNYYDRQCKSPKRGH